MSQSIKTQGISRDLAINHVIWICNSETVPKGQEPDLGSNTVFPTRLNHQNLRGTASDKRTRKFFLE